MTCGQDRKAIAKVVAQRYFIDHGQYGTISRVRRFAVIKNALHYFGIFQIKGIMSHGITFFYLYVRFLQKLQSNFCLKYAIFYSIFGDKKQSIFSVDSDARFLISIRKTKEAPMTDFFHENLAAADPDVAAIIGRELARQQSQIELIASENIVSRAVLDAMGSVLTNKYAEGYPGHRYYQGCVNIDEAETLAIERAKKIFGCGFANVQPHSGANANLAVLFATVKPGDTMMGMSLDAGGHLTHGARPTISGKWFNAVQYGLTPDGLIDYDAAARLAAEHKPKLIIAGGSAYPRLIDFKRFREIADSVGAKLMVDMAHFAGLVAAGLIESPIGIADIVTTTTHKTLRGPRGGMILTNDAELAQKIDKAIFPGTQGGPLEHIIAGKAVAFGEILQPGWKPYAQQIMKNIRVLGDNLVRHGFDLVSGGTDTHLILVDLRKKGISGADADSALEAAGITCNKNAIPNDPLPPTKTSGIRLGSPAVTTRGFREPEMEAVGDMIARVIDAFVATGKYENETQAAVRAEVRVLCARFPIY